MQILKVTVVKICDAYSTQSGGNSVTLVVKSWVFLLQSGAQKNISPINWLFNNICIYKAVE